MIWSQILFLIKEKLLKFTVDFWAKKNMIFRQLWKKDRFNNLEI